MDNVKTEDLVASLLELEQTPVMEEAIKRLRLYDFYKYLVSYRSLEDHLRDLESLI